MASIRMQCWGILAASWSRIRVEWYWCRFWSSAKARSSRTDPVSVEKVNARLISAATVSISSVLNSPTGEIRMLCWCWEVKPFFYEGSQVWVFAPCATPPQAGFKGSGFRINLGFGILEFGFKVRLRRINLIKNDRAKRYNKSEIRSPKSKIAPKSWFNRI